MEQVNEAAVEQQPSGGKRLKKRERKKIWLIPVVLAVKRIFIHVVPVSIVSVAVCAPVYGLILFASKDSAFLEYADKIRKVMKKR